eukprot:SAG31_NODE_8685_length_1406_cov_1.308340_3_plen_76_part_01
MEISTVCVCADAACNPTDSTGSVFRCWPKTSDVGYADVKKRYAARKPSARSTMFDAWKWNASQLLGGAWYSTQGGG